jgi:hypothetical protein
MKGRSLTPYAEHYPYLEQSVAVAVEPAGRQQMLPAISGDSAMELILIIVLVLFLFGGGGYWGRRRGHWWSINASVLFVSHDPSAQPFHALVVISDAAIVPRDHGLGRPADRHCAEAGAGICNERPSRQPKSKHEATPK